MGGFVTVQLTLVLEYTSAEGTCKVGGCVGHMILHLLRSVELLVAQIAQEIVFHGAVMLLYLVRK
jgi:hypothetical protein